MNKKDLTDLGIAEDVAEKIIVLHGKDIEAKKGEITAKEAELTASKDQLKAANEQIQKFKDLKPEELQGKVTEWETKYGELVTKHENEAKQRLFDGALDKGLAEAKAKNALTVKPLLNLDQLKYNEADGSLVGLKEQLEKIKADEKNGFLFEAEGEENAPIIVTGSKGAKPTDAVVAAARAAAGLTDTK